MWLFHFLVLSLTSKLCFSFYSPVQWKRSNDIYSDSYQLRGRNTHFHKPFQSYRLLSGPMFSRNIFSDWFSNLGKGSKVLPNTNSTKSDRSISIVKDQTASPPSKPAMSVYKFKFEFPNIFNKFHKQEEHKIEPEEECRKKGGKLVLGECYKYIDEELSYFEAVVDCQSRGAILWTPDLSNPFLLHFLAKEMPEIVSGEDDTLWVGGYFRNNRVVTIEGVDITDSYAIHVDDNDQSFDENECLVIEIQNGGVFTGSFDCENNILYYACEIDLQSDTDIVIVKKG